MSSIQIPTNPQPPKKGDRVMAKDVAMLWQAVKQLTARIDRRRQLINQKKIPYPFQISVTNTLLKSAPGLLGEVEIASQEEENPADGTWYLVAKVIINATTGAITSSTVEWTTTVPADTTTNYHLTIANLEILDGQSYTEINGPRQFTYGPISVVVGGGRDSKWMVRML